MKLKHTLAIALGTTLLTGNIFANDMNKVSCTEVDATLAKCTQYDADTTACDALVQTEIDARLAQAKTELDECKKKHSMQYLMKCKNEVKKATTASNTPKKVASIAIQKELAAKPDTACGKAEAIGNATKVCKGPKKALELMKANCIKA